MPAEIIDIESCIANIGDAATVMVGGFGVPGTPFCLLEELVRQGQTGLTLIKNDANENGMGVDHLLLNGQVDKLIVSHIGLNSTAINMMNAGEIEVELCPQGILAERIRIAGAGLFGFLTDIGIDTILSEGKPRYEVDGQTVILEKPLHADFALIHAALADSFGNLIYTASAQNFNPLMAMAGKHVIAEVEAINAPGQLAPDSIHTPAPFVDHLVCLTELTKDYGVVQR
jgi:acetate CoA/acetoacetate CoA-transferase alpha subunit